MAIDFRAKQAEFAAYIRDPLHNPPPADVQPERMAVYQELFFNNIDSFLSTNFPVLRSLLNDQQWESLARDFYAHHACHTPYFSEIAEEFLAYLSSRNSPDDFPFICELAHYEWVEMALAIAQEEPQFADQAVIDSLEQHSLMVSPLAWLLAYQYPVQQISANYLPQTPPAQPTYLVVYRDQQDAVHFMQPAPVTFRLLQLFQQQPQTAQEAIKQLALELPGADPKRLLQQGISSLQMMAAKGIVIPALLA